MKRLFPGYFTPTEEEFAKLWGDATFGFDANVLLGLYRSTSATQEVFFTILEKIADRIFLPHQAASEYLENRLNVISVRSQQYGRIKSESEGLAKVVESIVQEHAVLNGEEISKQAKESANKIVELVDAAAGDEPDLLREDSLLAQLAVLFEKRTGEQYEPARLKEIYAEGAQRYAQGVPPGYKDEKKGDPAKYGDLLIWFQLMDQAKSEQKPIIFVTGDVKEDWLLQHRGETLGPRPELRQEMMTAASVHFYMYTTPRFLEFAKQFLGLTLDTKKAESEFEKIEKQDKQAAELNALPTVTYSYTDYLPQQDQGWVNWGTIGSQPISFGLGRGGGLYPEWTPPIDSASKSKYFELLPINGQMYRSSAGKWKCEIVTHPMSDGNDRVNYSLKFEPEDRARATRYLRVWVSLSRLEHDTDWAYKKAIFEAILKWLGSNQISGEIAQFA